MLAKNPGITLVGGAGLAVGIAISAGVFSVIGTMVDPALPLEEGERIVAIGNFDVSTGNDQDQNVVAYTVADDGSFDRSSEREVLHMLAAGLGNKEIATRLGISDHTAKFHVSQILSKLPATSRAEAVSIAMRRGLVPL